MRRILVVLHRWLGLFTAIFLFVAGLTGAVISWDHELDEWLNPTLFEAKSKPAGAAPASAFALADQLEASDPRLRVRYLPLHIEAGHSLLVSVDARVDPATGAPFPIDFNQVALDPGTGEVLGKRFWGAVSLSRENLLPFLYRLHYTMHIPDASGLELGVLFMGIVALVWCLDGFIALWISFPSLRAWRKSFAYRFRAGGPKLVFDLHRSTGVWLWGLLLVLAVTGVSMNLERQVMRPLVSLLSPLTPSPFDAHVPLEHVVEPQIDRSAALKTAQAEARRRGLTAPAGGLFYAPQFGTYGVGFFEPGGDHGDLGLGTPWIYVDGRTGAPAGAQIPGEGTAGDVFMQAQFPLHSGRILGVFGRVLVSALGLVVAMLSVTGVLIWARKRRARIHQRERLTAMQAPEAAPSAPHASDVMR